MIGPLVDQKQLETVMDYIERGTQEGASWCAAGARPQGPQRPDTSSSPPFSTGSPDMAMDARRSSGRCCRYWRSTTPPRRCGCERLDVRAGGGVWTRDLDVALSTAKAIRSGTVWVNAYFDAGLSLVMPMGGYKASGIGRELGQAGLQAVLRDQGRARPPSRPAQRADPQALTTQSDWQRAHGHTASHRTGARLDPADLTIERIEVVPIRVPLGRVFRAATTRMTHALHDHHARLHREGIVGEATTATSRDRRPRSSRSCATRSSRGCIGKDAFNIEGCWEAMLPGDATTSCATEARAVRAWPASTARSGTRSARRSASRSASSGAATATACR